MSHFTCLVIGSDVAAALQPFHEFECTGTNDKFVQDIDVTEEKREEYESDEQHIVVDPQGTAHYMFTVEGEYDVRFCTKGGRGDKKEFIPPGWTEGSRPTKERFTMAEWLTHDGIRLLDPKVGAGERHKYGYFMLGADGEVSKVVRRTNPNRKWDWWVVGGRWANKLLFKNGRCGDTGLVGEIDWDGMLREKADAAAALFDRITAGIAGRPVRSWKQIYARQEAGEFSIEEARDFYNGQRVVQELREAEVLDSWDGDQQLSSVLAASDRQSYIDRESMINASSWGFLLDGQWYERGDMGWFGMSDADDDSIAQYSKKFWDVIRSLSPDARVTVVDCHI